MTTSRPWSEEEAAIATRIWNEMQGKAHVTRKRMIARSLGRSYGSVDGRYTSCGGAFTPEPRTPRESTPWFERVPDDVLAERDRRLAVGPRDLISELMGDPLPGRSALERRA